MTTDTDYKLQLSNHYRLEFDRFSQLLGASAEISAERGRIPVQMLADAIGTVYRKAENYVSMAKALGLLTPTTLVPSPLGRLIVQYDPYFDDTGLLWLLHYNIGAEPRHYVWNRFVNRVVPENRFFDREKVLDYFGDLGEHFTGKDAPSHLSHEVTTVLDAYTNQQFSRLGYIREQSDGQYGWGSSEPIPPLIALAATLLYRDRFLPGATSLEFSHLVSAPNSVGRVFNLIEADVRRLADELRAMGTLYIESRADLDQIRFRNNYTVVEVVEGYFQERH
ncbi:MAG: DUF4007 family protein [Anaerolineales bacterium]|nr:MAG: DUF4007 family protein [Anaerolineales bacterium]